MTADLYRKGLALYERHRDIVSYLFWGVMTTLVNYVAYFVCRLCFGIDYIASNVAAWAVAVAFGFVVNKIYVFRSLDWSAKVAFRECWQFVVARLFSGVLETAMLKVFVDWLGMNDAIVKIFSNIVVVIVNYVLSKLVIFRKKQVLLEKLEQASASCAKQAAALPAAEEPVQAQGAIAGRKRRRRRADGASPQQGASAAKAQGKAKPKGRAKGGAKGRRTRRKGRR